MDDCQSFERASEGAAVDRIKALERQVGDLASRVDGLEIDLAASQEEVDFDSK